MITREGEKLHRDSSRLRYDAGLCFPVTEFAHQFIPSAGSARTLLLLHGTGGDENDLLPLGRALDPEAALLSPRGRVSENGANRFFRRLAEGVFDEEDVIARAKELAEWIAKAAGEYRIGRDEIVLTGYSNGANVGSAMMLLGAGEFRTAILLRPMVPLSHPPAESLENSRVLLLGGNFDPIATPAEVNRLSRLFLERNVEVTERPQAAGHELTPGDVQSAREWLAARPKA